jgi:myosin heavy subunit
VNLNYEKIKTKVEHGGNHWTSYSDLFLVLSVVFLLLYVVANLRSGTVSIAQYTQLQQAKTEAEELRKQIKAYDSLNKDYLKNGASSDEIQMYQELMGKLSLLETEAKDESVKAAQKARDAKEKEEALNRYQQMVKNVISANLVSAQRLKKRDLAIVERDQAIVERNNEIEALDRSIQQKESVIDANNQTIAGIENKLQQQIQEVQNAYKANKSNKEQAEKQIAQLKADSMHRIDALRQENSSYMNQLQAAQQSILEKNREAEKLIAQLSDKDAKYNQAIGDLEKAHQDALQKEKAAYENGLKSGTQSMEAKLAQEKAYKDAVERQNAAFNDQLGRLKGELAANREQLKGVEGKYQNDIGSLQKANDALAKNLQGTLAKLNQQRELANRIKENFKKAGINADVDLKTGDVTINFQNEYFDTGSANLKGGMLQILKKFMPEYAKSLFQDPKIASRIANVEIVGFASPTYKGKYVDPSSLSQEDRAAVNFNMDLSYQRAKSIFEPMFDTRLMQFQHQSQLLPLVKVTGRSFLATERIPGRTPSSGGDYCQNFDCKKSQRVIIKFNLKDE